MEINNKNIGYYIYFLVNIINTLVYIYYPWSIVEYNFQRSGGEQSLLSMTCLIILVSIVLFICRLLWFLMDCYDGKIQFNYKLSLPFGRKPDKSSLEVRIAFYEMQLQEYIRLEDVDGQKDCLAKIKELKSL